VRGIFETNTVYDYGHCLSPEEEIKAKKVSASSGLGALEDNIRVQMKGINKGLKRHTQ
jgi:hypothetical protein